MRDDNRGWLQTFTGKKVWPLDPRPEDICIEDIAHALSNICRYTGHVRRFYSVAQHSVLVSQILPRNLQLCGLLHDAAEAYICDLPRPLKQSEPFGSIYKEHEETLERCIAEKFSLPFPWPLEIKHADNVLLMTERRDLMATPPRPWTIRAEPLDITIHPWSPENSELRFIERFDELQRIPRRG